MRVTADRPALDITKTPDVRYVIPLWLRDEQIKANTARVTARIEPAREKRADPVAVVGFGPSLVETWEQIRSFRYVVSCSGAHRFLIDRGIVPTWHVEVDPRDHKIQLLGEPHPDVEYLIASTCHPKYVQHLAGFNVKLWHVFDSTEEGLRLLPHGEWAVTGGCDAGLRAMTLSAFLGFRDLHVFGMDGCARGTDRHAGEHPHGKQKYQPVEHDGVTYWTTPAMLAASQQTLHELEQMPAVHATFYGAGLTQSLTKDYSPRHGSEPEQPYAGLIGFYKPAPISPAYALLNEQLHRENFAYGVGGAKHVDLVLKIATSIKARSILDYGCGKGLLAKALPFPIWEYDPAVPGKTESPRSADLVVCTDVLEHIEPDKLKVVLKDLSRCVKQVGYFVIHMGPAGKTLPDGRNTHLIQKGERWWRTQLETVFEVGTVKKRTAELHIIVGPKKKKTR